MNRYKRRYRRIKKFYRKGKRTGKYGWKKFQKKVRSVIQSSAEHKYSLTPGLGAALNQSIIAQQTYTVVQPLPAIPQGTQEGQRIGDSITLRYMRFNAKLKVNYGNIPNDVHSVYRAVQDDPDEFWCHVCRPCKGNCGAGGAQLAANVAAYFNVANNRSQSCMPKPIMDTNLTKFYIEKTYKLKPGNEFSMYNFIDITANNGAMPTTGKDGWGFMRYTYKKFKGKKLKFSANGDTIPMNTSWLLVFVNNCTNANNIALEVDWHSVATYTDV